MREDAEVKKRGTKEKWAGVTQLSGAVFGHRDAK
jgi:hypothetical protein